MQDRSILIAHNLTLLLCMNFSYMSYWASGSSCSCEWSICSRVPGGNCIKKGLPRKLILSKRNSLQEAIFSWKKSPKIYFPGRPILDNCLQERVQAAPPRHGRVGKVNIHQAGNEKDLFRSSELNLDLEILVLDLVNFVSVNCLRPLRQGWHDSHTNNHHTYHQPLQAASLVERILFSLHSYADTFEQSSCRGTFICREVALA